MTFYEWLTQFLGQGNQVGDLAYDVQHDECLPRDGSPSEIRNHILGVHHPERFEDVMQILDGAVQMYEARQVE